MNEKVLKQKQIITNSDVVIVAIQNVLNATYVSTHDDDINSILIKDLMLTSRKSNILQNYRIVPTLLQNYRIMPLLL